MSSHWPQFSRSLFLVTVIALCALASASASANPKYASLVIDANTGEDIRARNADATRYPASLTKIMTLYVLFEEIRAGRIKKTDRITFSAHAAGQPPSELGLQAGETLTVDNAIRALVTKSANDVAAAVAEHISGSESAFARRMTDTARRLGMSDTTFRNASGLPDSEQVTTARDMATLGLRIIRDFPDEYQIFSLKSFTYQGRTYSNHNRLLGNYSGTDGIKTGYIRDSGYNLVASVRRGNRHAIAVVMGGKTGASRDAHMRAILDESFPQIAEYYGPPPRPKPDFIAELESLVTGRPAGEAPTTEAVPAAPVAEAEPAAVAEPAASAAPAMPAGIVRLTMVETPTRNRELPLTEPVERPHSWPPGIVDRAVPAPAASPTAMSAFQAPTAQATPETAAAYATEAAAESRVDAIERLIASAMAEPYIAGTAAAAPAPETHGGRLILPRAAATTADVFAEAGVGDAPEPEALEVPEGYQIQVGAYASRDDAQARLERALDNARGLLSEAMGFTPTVEQKSGTVLYRARFAGLDKDDAQEACRTLKQRRIDCIVVAR